MVNAAARVVCSRTLRARTVDNNVTSDSRSNAVGIAARNVIAGQETNVIQNQDGRSSDQYDSQQAARPESSQSSSSSQGNVTDFWAGLRQMPRGVAIGVIATENHEVVGDLVNRVTNSGDGRAIAVYNPNVHVGGTETNIIIHQGTIGQSEDYVTDDSIFKKFGLSKGPGCYKLEKPSCALIINNCFDNDPDPEYAAKYREGAKKDTQKMRGLFKDFFKFLFVRTEENVSSERLPVILEKFRADVKTYECSSCFIIIMSHGGKSVNSILMDDLKEPKPDLYTDIVYKFSDHDDVRAIPKVFIVQACRDHCPPISNGTEIPTVSIDAEIPPVSKDSKIPRGIQNVLIAQSTCPHFPAGLHNVKGALYFTVLDEVFRANAKDSKLCYMLHKVYYDNRLKERGQNPGVELYGFQDYRFKLN